MTKPEDMTNEELLDAYRCTAFSRALSDEDSDLERSNNKQLNVLHTELLRRLGAAGSHGPRPNIEEIIDRLNIVGRLLVAMDDLEPSDPMTDAIETAQCDLGSAIELLKRATQFFAAAPAEDAQISGGNTMEYQVVADRLTRGDWRVEAINHAGEGECFVTIFSGSDSETRAKEYASWKNQ